MWDGLGLEERLLIPFEDMIGSYELFIAIFVVVGELLDTNLDGEVEEKFSKGRILVLFSTSNLLLIGTLASKRFLFTSVSSLSTISATSISFFSFLLTFFCFFLRMLISCGTSLLLFLTWTLIQLQRVYPLKF